MTWTDTSSDEDRFEIWVGTLGVGITWNLLSPTAPGANTQSWTVCPTNRVDAFRIRSVNAYRASNFSTTLDKTYSGDCGTPVVPPATPVGPSDFQAAPIPKTSDRLMLTWTDNSTEEEGFYIFRSTDNVNWQKIQLPANSSSYPDTGLNSCTHYYYRVAAYNGAGSTSEATGDAYTPPAPPTGLIATTGPGVFGVHLDWADTSCAVKYIVYYLTDYYSDYQPAIGGDILQSTVNVLDVEPDIYFFYRVSAIDKNGNEGAWSCATAPSAPSAGATSSSDPCKAAVGWAKSPVPVNLWGSQGNFTNKVIIGWDSTPLTWNTNGEPTSYAAQYDVFISQDNATWSPLQGSPFSHPHNPPDATPIMLTQPTYEYATSKTYYFKVQTRFYYDGNWMSSLPAYISATTAAIGTPPAQTDVLPAPGVMASLYYPNKIMVRWSTISGATGYKVYRSGPNNSGSFSLIQTFGSTATGFDDTAIQPYADYWYKVQAMKNTVAGQLSDAAYGNASAYYP